MVFRAREVDQRRAVLVVVDDPEVDPEVVGQEHRGLRLAASEHLRHVLVRTEAFHRLARCGRRRQDVDVSDRGTTTPERAHDVDPVERVGLPQSGLDLRGDREGPPQKHPFPAPPGESDVVQDVLLGPLAEAVEFGDLALPGRPFEVFERRDAEFQVESLRRLRSHPLDARYRVDVDRQIRLQLLVVAHLTGVEILGDPGGDGLTDALDLFEFAPFVNVGDVFRERLDAPGRPAVGLGLVLDLAYLQEVGDLAKYRRYLPVFHLATTPVGGLFASCTAIECALGTDVEIASSSDTSTGVSRFGSAGRTWGRWPSASD